MNRRATGNYQQTFWPFVIFTLTMGGIVIGTFSYQTNSLSRTFDARMEVTDQKIMALGNRLEQQMGQIERNLDACFEDLKQEVRSRK